MGVELVRISNPQQWAAFHDIRRTVLFEGRGRFGVYDENHPDDRLPENHALLLIEEGKPRGALRLDFSSSGCAIVRTVAIETSQQRRGLGRSMMNLVENYATAGGIDLLEVNSALDAVEFYLRLGWQMIDPHRKSPLLRKKVGPRARDC